MAELWDPTRPDSFDPNKFYTASVDSKGHSDYMKLRVPVYIADIANDFARSGAIPALRRGPDVFRSGGVALLNWGIHIFTPELEPKWSDIVQKDEADARAQARQNAKDLVETLKKGLQEARFSSTQQQFAIELEAAKLARDHATDPEIRSQIAEIISRY